MATLTEQLDTLPATPGVYLFKDAQGNILYVGKAKRLTNRVRSYFQASANLDPAKQQMIPRIAQVETITCDTENEALVLEANLIREHRPPYNVLLTDDKYYLFIKITKEKYPRVLLVRRIKTDGARYFGPYSSASAVRNTLKLLRRLFPHQTDTASTSKWNFPHPLFTRQTSNQSNLSHEEYQANIRQIIRFLKGDRHEIVKTLRQGMKHAAAHRQFEQAAVFRDQLAAIERLDTFQKVHLPSRESFDIISVATDKNRSAVNIFSIRQGRLLNKNTFHLRHRLNTLRSDIVRQFILQYYTQAQDIPPSILIPTALTDQAAVATWINSEKAPVLHTPTRGVKKQLLDLGHQNAQQALQQASLLAEHEDRLEQAIQDLQKALALTQPLHRIETYDVSNIQGKLATASMVVFTDGKPDKAQYKKFRLRLPDTPNDFAMLAEALERRFSARNQSWPRPDLIIIDGGKGQLSAAQKILARTKNDIPIISLAKREEEVFVPGRPQAIRLPYDSDALYLLQRMRDEAHRFTITYHRLLRSKQQKRSLLDEVPGIGPKTKKQLLNHFGSLKAIRAASLEETAAIIGTAKAKILHDYL